MMNDRAITLLRRRVGKLSGQLDQLQAKVEEVQGALSEHADAVGNGFWRARGGTLVAIRDVSTHSLVNIFHSNFKGLEVVHDLVRKELRRRVEDAQLLRDTLASLDLEPEERARESERLATLGSEIGGDIEGDIDVEELDLPADAEARLLQHVRGQL